MTATTEADISDPSSWPPGSIMVYSDGDDSYNFSAVGIVVGNDGHDITVLWSENCATKISTYTVKLLNPRVISLLN